MAANKFYSYYLRGGQIALIEQDIDNNGIWKSPVATVADGLEIEYAYSPRYTFDKSTFSLGENKLITPSWFINDSGYLSFTTYANALANGPLQLGTHPWSQLSADVYFVITNNSRWNGLHKVQTVNSNGWFSTYTKSSNSHNTGNLGVESGGELNAHTDGYIHADDVSGFWLNLILSVGDYVFIPDNVFASGDGGHYKVTSISETDASESESAQKAYIGTKYFLNEEDDLDEFQSGDSHLATDAAGYGAKVIWDPCYINLDVNVLNDETDIIDIPEYLAKALVYYVKAKMAEDQRDLELKEYFMREFRKMVEKQESSKIWGARLVVPASNAIR